ncbi:DUF2834 domain-containing protein [Oscillatoria sp. FACHB-1407]|uniref:DUF2834 domain-containing protein n=1 Tax=Oscillatoria sp. FACHB-1407 TaxID=2692847 RepID=UPI001689A9FB|nr:DUF2834 domain-containing protein [Oscillatoria sp. FACHB-1407]MBD2461636.1 DUF2834 domain-containing protein [Oscillatoria sp. FACHB-1407]
MNRVIFWGLWIGFIGYAFFLAPPNQPDTAETIQRLVTGDWQGINPLIVALFNTLGIVPLIYASFLLIDGRMQKVPASLFVAGSFGVGAFALLPYFALRQPNGTFAGQKNWLLKWLDSRWNGLAIALLLIPFVAYGMIAGDWSDFAYQWQTSRFVHVMSLDFCMLCLIFPAILGDDMARRGLSDRRLFWAASLIPLFGAVAYLVLRPPIQERSEKKEEGRGREETLKAEG